MQAAGPAQRASVVPTVPSFDDLPDPVLEHIFEIIGLEGLLPAALLVCKRWHARLFATPAVWRQLEVAAPNLPADATAQWAAWETAAAQLLRRVSGFATAVQLDSRRRRQARWVTSALRLLQPAGIREVSLLAYQLPASPFALEPLRRLTQLTSLQLCCEGAQPAEADPIAGLIHLVPAPPLRSLRLEAHGLPQATLNALVQLSSLTDLQLVLRAGPLPHLQALTRLVRLRQLLVDDGSGYVPLHKVQLPAPADFAALERYAIQSLFTHTLVMGEIPLQALEFSSSTCPDGQNAGTTHGMLHVTAAQVAPAPEVGAWRPLLEAAVPRRKQLHSLSMQSCRFSVFGAPSAMLGAPQCAQLRELQLLDCLAQPSTHSMDDIVRGLLPSLPDLSCFKLSSPADPKAGHRLREFPAAIFSHPALTRAEVLTVRKEDWDELAMPLLLDPRLELLSVVGFSRLPPALSAVTSLTELRLGNAQLLTFQLGEEGLVALQQLPTLARLALPPLSDEDQHRVAQLRRDRPQLLVQIGGAGGQ